MDRNKWIALGTVTLVAVFLLGWFPQWQRAQGLDTRLEAAERELAMARIEGRIGAALAESMRSNYERSRQLMTSAFEEMEGRLDAGEIADPRQQQAVRAILGQRDELVTMLARAEPEAQQRLMLLYTRYFEAIDPEGRRAPTAVTPSAPPQ